MGPAFHNFGHLHMVTTFTWVPGIYWLGLRLVRRGRFFDLAGVIAFSCLSYTAGDLEPLVYSWAMFYFFLAAVERPGLVRLVLPAAGLIISVLICAAPFLLTIKFMEHTSREALAPESLSTNWKWLSMFFLFPLVPVDLVPGIMEKYCLYFGLLLPAGFAAALRDPGERRLTRAVAALFLASLIYYINLWPFHYIFNILPVIKYTIVESRYRVLFPLTLLMLLAAVRGFERAGKEVDRPTAFFLLALGLYFAALQAGWVALEAAAGRLGALTWSRAALTAAVPAAAGYLVWGRRRGRRSIPIGVVIAFFILDLYAFAFLAMPRMRAEELDLPTDFTMLTGPISPERYHPISLVESGPGHTTDHDLWKLVRLDQGPGILFAPTHGGTGPKYHGRVMQQLADGYTWFSPHFARPETLPMLNFLSVRQVFSQAAATPWPDPQHLNSPLLKSSYGAGGGSALRQPPRSERGYLLSPGAEWKISVGLYPGDVLAMEVFPARARMFLTVRLEGPGGRVTLAPGESENGSADPGRVELALPVAAAGDYLLSLMADPAGAEAITIGSPLITNPARPFALTLGTRFLLYENRHYLERYGFYSRAEAVADEEALRRMFEPGRYHPELDLFIAPELIDPAVAAQPARARKPGDARVDLYLDTLVELSLDAPSPGYLSVAESYYPGWRAWVDGVETRMVRANYAYQALPIAAAGPHRVRLAFLPREFEIGLWASLVSLAALLVTAALKLAAARARENDTPGTQPRPPRSGPGPGPA